MTRTLPHAAERDGRQGDAHSVLLAWLHQETFRRRARRFGGEGSDLGMAAKKSRRYFKQQEAKRKREARRDAALAKDKGNGKSKGSEDAETVAGALDDFSELFKENDKIRKMMHKVAKFEKKLLAVQARFAHSHNKKTESRYDNEDAPDLSKAMEFNIDEIKSAVMPGDIFVGIDSEANDANRMDNT